jgi:hypothetical protein
MSQTIRGFLWLCLSTSLIAQTSDEGYKSRRARKALVQYDEALKKLNQEYAKNLAGIQKQYADELEESRKAALEAKNLDDAQRILTTLIALEEEMKEGKAGPGFVLLSAKYGAADKWIDVTTNLRRLLKRREPLSVAPDELRVNDPAFGLKKSLAVVYQMQGKIHLEMFSDGSSVVIPPARKTK